MRLLHGARRTRDSRCVLVSTAGTRVESACLKQHVQQLVDFVFTTRTELARSVEGSSWRLPLQRKRNVQVQVHGLVSTHSPQAKTSTHIDSVSASYRGAAASLIDKSFDQSEVYGGFCRRAKPRAGAGAWLWQQPSTLHKQRRASALSRPPPRTVEQPEACSISWKFMAASVAKAKPPSCRCRCMVLVASKHSPQAETSKHLESNGNRTA